MPKQGNNNDLETTTTVVNTGNLPLTKERHNSTKIEQNSTKKQKNNNYRRQTKNVEQAINFYPERKPYIEISQLDVYYGSGSKKFHALKDINLNIYEGEVVGLVGESGSGKSTLGRTLVGLVNHQHGKIRIGDYVIPYKMNFSFKKLFKLREYLKLKDFLVNKVQMIFQDPANSLNPNKNIYNVIAEGLNNISTLDMIYRYNFDEKTLNEIKYEVGLILAKNTANNDYHEHSEYELYLELRKNLKRELVALKELEMYDLASQMLSQFKEKEVKELANNYIPARLNRRKYDIKKSKSLKKEELIVDVLKSVGLDESILKRYPLEFSGGQQQRVGVSRSLVVRPKILIADEPISALDVSIQAQVINIFNDLKDRFDLTIVFIAHDLRMVEYISDRIVVMNNGRILEMGPTKEIVNNYLHPYTKSLMDAVPSLKSKKGSLLGYRYSPKIHNYSKVIQPEWIDLGNSHFVLATHEEIENWKQGIYE